jgi:biopolymer transport protein ExbD
MAGSSSGGGGGGTKKARIEIIPLIDVIFFLLATFVLFTLALNKSNGLPVKLPESYTGEPRDPANSATVTVTKEGTIAWDKEPIALDEFLRRIQAFYAADPINAKVFINGDTEASFSQAIYVLDESRKAGITKVYIETLATEK